MGYSSDYEAVKLLAQALSERDHEKYEQAVETLKRVIVICDGRDTVTCQYVTRTAYSLLYEIKKAAGLSEEAARYQRKAIKLGVTKEELERE